MASSLLKTFLLLSAIFCTRSWAVISSSSSSTATLDTHLVSIKSVCKSTPYPDACFDSLKLSISVDINITPNILSYLLQTLQIAISEAGKVLDLFSTINGDSGIVEKQRGAIRDCKELHQITITSLQRSMSWIQSDDARKLSDARAFLSAALTNKNTCLEGLDSATGPLKPVLVQSIISSYKHVSNSLSLLPKPAPQKMKGGSNRRLMGFPAWLSPRDRRILQSSGGDYNPSDIITVAKDGTGNFTTITAAINFAPSYKSDRIIIYVREGIYKENVDIPSFKTNIVLLGDGADSTVITGSRSMGDGWTTFSSATLGVSGNGFLARDMAFMNTAGPGKQQAVALRVNADLSAVYRCKIVGYQDTLYVHSFRQFYRESDIYGTVDFICGNAAVVFQGCNMIARLPIPGQFNVITAQARDNPDMDTGISIQNCSILASDDLSSKSGSVKSYLGRPWTTYSRTVYMESYIDSLIDPSGWVEWSGDQGLDTLYYGEYENSGPGSDTDGRVTWPGYHIMDYEDARAFTVSEFIAGDQWLDSTSFPYDDGV
ncbi:PREDICTED: probable pectinesterase/pectinesterase inhibitor 12 [Nelumbo nucifera]|uniref:Probable pectinesterase/pectinesterase inhibitor 12 n=1 Tax=Nelumbo nucifera TaxID=4432 RepID=A0A1U8B4V9_NELNU|nr:PREDICTED: probable pectinesterase/pectinesterase inhibitor 12 [Nelumbo nucifera]